MYNYLLSEEEAAAARSEVTAEKMCVCSASDIMCNRVLECV